MNPLDELELRVCEMTDPETAIRAREFIVDAIARDLICICQIADLVIELEHGTI